MTSLKAIKSPLIIIFTGLILLVSHHAFAQNTLNEQLTNCQKIHNDKDRLKCFDLINNNEDEPQLSQHSQSTTIKNNFPALIADLNEPNLFVSYGKLDFLGSDFNSVLISLGKRQPVKTFNLTNEHTLSFNVFGQIRSQFDVSEIHTRNNRGGALINTDFSVGGELQQSLEKWNWRFSYTHKSTHLGDEFIIDHPNYLKGRINLSYETIRWTAHKNIKQWDMYAGIGFITRSEPSDLGKEMWQIGTQYFGRTWHGFKPVFAVDLTSWSAYDWNININMRAGIEINQLSDLPFQLLLEYQDGHAPYGQFYNEDLTYFGLTLLQNW